MTEGSGSPDDGLRRTIEDLAQEVRALRGEVEQLKAQNGGRSAASPTSGAAPAKPAASKLTLTERLFWPAGKPPTPQKAPPKPAAPAPPARKPAASSLPTEQFIGERVLHYAGLTVLSVGIAFFLIWRGAHAGPEERVLMAAGAGAFLIALGLRLAKKPPYDSMAQSLVAGGWSVVYLTAYAAYHFEALRVISDPGVELALLLATAAAMVGHAIESESRGFRLFAVGLAYFVLFISSAPVADFNVIILLTAAAAVVAAATHFDILIVAGAGYYLHFLPVLWAGAGAPAAGTEPYFHALAQLAGGYLVIALLPVVPPVRGKPLPEQAQRWLDSALCLNAVGFAICALSLTRQYFDSFTLMGAIGLSAFLTVPGLAYIRGLPRRMQAGSFAPALGLTLLALGIFGMPGPLSKMLAWIAAASLWVGIGLLFDHPAWRVSGLLMALLTFGFYIDLARQGEHERRMASSALFFFSTVSYLFSRFYRVWLQGKLKDWEKPVMEYWLYIGTLTLLLGFWGVLDPAPLALVLAALAIVGELAAARFGRPHLWAQACALAAGTAVYTFFIDYGPDLPVLGPLTPRWVVSGGVIAALAYLFYADPTPPEFARGWRRWTQRQHRVLLSWLMLAVGAFAVYQELDARARLPAWALGATLLYCLGGARKDDQLKHQGVLLALAAAGEGVVSYLLYPSALLQQAGPVAAAIYWLSSGLILFNARLAKPRAQAGSALDGQAAWAFCVLSLGMMACYLAKELSSYYLTMAWSAEGLAFLAGGFALGWRELRLPALSLLGICVGKAVLLDTSQLPLPDRMASFIGLGVILIAASMLYVREGRDG